MAFISILKIAKKMAGLAQHTASWVTNISNEHGQVVNSVFTVGEGVGLEVLARGIVKRYQDAGEEPPRLLYVDRDCCAKHGDPKPLKVRRVLINMFTSNCSGLILVMMN